MEEKKEIINYLKQYRKISVKNICSDLKINYQNVMSGQASKKNLLKVKQEIERRLEVLREN